MNRKTFRFVAQHFCVVAMSLAIVAPRLSGQTVPVADQAGPGTSLSETDDEPVVLSPFIVESSEDDDRYSAKSTLAGTRVRTDLRDVASSITVVTAQFLKDTGATNNQTLLQYTTNTEVAGASGNFAGVGVTFTEGASESFAPPHLNTRVRGLDSADNTRDYFRSDIPWDSYNVGRVDIQRGPNSILFGLGSPAGIINASLDTAGFKNAGSFENRAGSYGTVRSSLDVNRVLVDNELALRLSLLDDHTRYRQDPAFSRDKRFFSAMRFEPKLFNRLSAHTSLRGNFEYGDIHSNLPRILPPTDGITAFFDPNGSNKIALDPYYAWSAGIVVWVDGSHPVIPGEKRNYWLNQNYIGGPVGTGPQIYFDSSAPGTARALSASPLAPSEKFGIGADGTQDSAIGGFPFMATAGIGNFNQYTISANQDDPALFPGAGSGFYKSTVITDPSTFDFYNHLIDGPNKREWQRWTAWNLILDQTFLDNRLGFQVAYDRQGYDNGSESTVQNAITVDINANRNSLPWGFPGSVTRYDGTGTPGTNPNAGRAYIAGNGHGGGNSRETTRETFRTTGTGELRAADFMRGSWLSDVLGRHVLTGLYSRESYEQLTKTWDVYAMDAAWDNALFTGPNADGSGVSPLSAVTRTLSWLGYVSDPLFSASSARGLHLPPLTAALSPAGTATIQYFDSHWKPSTDPSDPGYIDPAAPWSNPVATTDGPTDSTQSENPANYVGWRNGSFRILNTASGDIESLYSRGARLKQTVKSESLTWQGYFWDHTLAATFGWRRDVQTQRAGYAPIDVLTGAADMNFGFDPGENETRGISRSWGLVLHEPKAWRDKLPWGTNVSLIFDRGENTRVENRYGFDGSPLPNAKGKTTDYGFALSTLHERLQLKVTWYKTEVKDANISSVLSSENTLGSNAYYQSLLPPWALGDVLQAIAGMKGDPAANGSAYLWNWAATAEPGDPVYQDVHSDAFKNHPETIKAKAAIASFLDQLDTYFPQSWWDTFGYPVNVAAAKAGDYQNAVAGWNVSRGNWEITSATGGTVNGVPPVGTVDYVSKGIEFELVGKITDNWNVALNASKQRAYQSALGQQLVDYITKEQEFYASPAGDIRLWWGGDQGIRGYFEQNIGAAFRFQQQTNGKLTPEMAPWRFNGVTTYAFNRGALKGGFIGLGYRWEQGHILGYPLNAAQDNLDVDNPYWSKSQDHLDLWAGYERKLTPRIGWKIQLNLRNLGDRPRLDPISVQPDGTPALYRIREGMSWELTNTLSF